MYELAVAILAAGQGTRMRSALNKVLHPILGKPMILWSVDLARALGAELITLVIGNNAEAVVEQVGPGVQYALQAERLGTGHAVLQARESLQGRARTVLVLYGDMPTIRLETLRALVALHREHRPAVTLLSVLSDDSMGFGRVVRDAQGRAQAIVEEAVATPEIMALKELNCGVYCFDAEWLWRRLPDVPRTMPKGEYYLTDMVALAIADGRPVQVLQITDVSEVQGINNRVQLAEGERILRQRINEQHLLNGVTLVDPATITIEPDVEIGQDTVIHPNTALHGHTRIGANAHIGPNSVIRDSVIGDECRVEASHLEGATMERGANIGPFGHLRPGAHLAEGVHLGDYGEVKQAYLGPGTKMGHFSFVGDARVGARVNIGAGVITCNYDGRQHQETVIEDDAFIGSGAMLVAPVHIGKGARIGAGAVVTHDVPAGGLVYGVPARPQPDKEHGEQDER